MLVTAGRGCNNSNYNNSRRRGLSDVPLAPLLDERLSARPHMLRELETFLAAQLHSTIRQHLRRYSGWTRERLLDSLRKIRNFRRRVIGHAMVSTEACLEGIGVSSPSALLILGHMRSGSTLLLHLLLTNPEISALGERGAVYASRGDLARLVLSTRLTGRRPFRRLRYVADQVNHNHLTPSVRLLQHSRVRALFLLRQPEAAVGSILELYRASYPERYSLSGAVDYYVERVGGLMKLGAALRSTTCAALLSYETLTEFPEEALEALRSFLGLQQGFSQTYKTYPFTQTSGDPGPHIVSGRILRATATPKIQLPAAELERAREAYVQCSATLARFALLPARQ